MRKHAACQLTTTALALSVALACGGHSFLNGESAAGAAGASNDAGAASSAGISSSAGTSGTAGGVLNSGAGAFGMPSECDHDEDCYLAAKGCCGPYEPVDASQLLALSLRSDDYDNQHYNDCRPAPPCVPPPAVNELTDTRKYYRAVCFHGASGPTGPGQCQILDVRGTPYTSCTKTSECMLRDGVDCCPRCDGQNWVPVNDTIDFCDRGSLCERCDPFYPAGMAAGCEDGMCRFVPPAH